MAQKCNQQHLESKAESKCTCMYATFPHLVPTQSPTEFLLQQGPFPTAQEVPNQTDCTSKLEAPSSKDSITSELRANAAADSSTVKVSPLTSRDKRFYLQILAPRFRNLHVTRFTESHDSLQQQQVGLPRTTSRETSRSSGHVDALNSPSPDPTQTGPMGNFV